MPAKRDLVDVLYRPRETMRRVLDSGADRWTIPLVVLAFLSTTVEELDIRRVPEVLPDLTPVALGALVVLILVLEALLWIGATYVVAFVVTFIGRRFEGVGEAADVRAALAWSLVPLIWSVIVRAPLALYQWRYVPKSAEGLGELLSFVSKGGCFLVLLSGAIQLLLFLWVVYLASALVGEALHVPTLTGFGTLAITFALPVVIGIAAAIAFQS